MKTLRKSKSRAAKTNGMRSEYKFDYSQSRPNRFAGHVSKDHLIVLLEPDIAKVFKTPESVNNALRALLSAMPKSSRTKS
ncbi:MAG: hypothetical protein NT106_15275 [Candidatus Sumerlaeota bacterium]|nr:hypothetical protein [Candidatus Sumerlaeota bacterium]